MYFHIGADNISSQIAISRLGAEKIALTYLFEPVFATIAGVLILKEELSTEILIGGVFIISAMIISEVNFKKLRSGMFSQRTL